MKNILIIGGNSFVAKSFVNTTRDKKKYNYFLSNRKNEGDFIIDITSETCINNLNFGEHIFDAVLFLQGLNPSKNLEESNLNHFLEMYKVNIAGPAQLIKKLLPNLNENSSIVFINSIASIKGSYDPSYAASKSALNGFISSLTNAYTNIRFNSVMLGLVENSPVYNGMTDDFKLNHSNRMYGNKFIQVENVVSVLNELINNPNINNSCIPLHGGYNY